MGGRSRTIHIYVEVEYGVCALAMEGGNVTTAVEKEGGGEEENHSGKVGDGVEDCYEEVNDGNDDHQTYYTENVYGFSDKDRDWNIKDEGGHEGKDEFGDSESVSDEDGDV